MARRDIEFDAEGVTLRGWFYDADGRSGAAPTIVMAHGFSAVKEMYLDEFAEVFAAAGLNALVFDNRNFGASDGEPRQEIDPVQQVRDYRHAITYATTLTRSTRRGSGSGAAATRAGTCSCVGAIDRRVKAVVAQVPLVSGSANIAELVRADFRAGFRQMFDDDRAARFRGDPPAMVPVVAEDPLAPSALPTPDSWTWFTETGKTRAPSWKNEVTLRTVEMLGEYEPAAYIARISPTPLLMVVAREDHLTPAAPRHRRLRARPRAQAPGDPAGRPLRRLRRRLRRGQRPRPRLVRRTPRGGPLSGTTAFRSPLVGRPPPVQKGPTPGRGSAASCRARRGPARGWTAAGCSRGSCGHCPATVRAACARSRWAWSSSAVRARSYSPCRCVDRRRSACAGIGGSADATPSCARDGPDSMSAPVPDRVRPVGWSGTITL